MRVRDSTGGAVRPGAAPGPAPAGAAAPALKTGTAPGDVATILGIPEPELTPRVRAAIDRLLAEAQSLREQLAQARRRISYLEEMADQDTLTPVMNRRAFVRELARRIAYAERYEVPGSVIYFDVDGMKAINDAHGHAAGDAVLKRVAEVLLGTLRGSDVVGRLGGDEFGVILSHAEPHPAATKALALAESITWEPVLWDGRRLEVTVSYGVYTFAGGERADDALHAADQAMYAYKHRAGLAARHP